MLCKMGQEILLFGTGHEIPDVPKCKIICPRRLSPAASAHLSFAMSASLLRDASEGAEMRITRLEFIMMAAGPSVALVAIFNRLTGTG